MMESRPRVSRRSLIIGGIVVGVVTFIVLIAEGIITFNTTTAHTGLMVVEATSGGAKKSKPVGDKVDSSSSSSASSSPKDGAVAVKNTPSRVEKDSVVRNDDDEDDLKMTASVSGAEPCRSLADNSVVSTSKCHACSSHDKIHIVECAETRNVEQTVTCVGGKPTNRKYRSCKRKGDAAEEEEKRKFIVFEAVNFGLGIAAYFIVLLRRKRLDSALAKKIEEQLATGV